jgi:hypothetical protein
MKGIKLTLLTATLLFSCTDQLIGQARGVFYDATALSQIYKKYQGESPPREIVLDGDVEELLIKYVKDETKIEEEISANPFLKEYFAYGGVASLPLTAGELSSNIAAVSGLNITNLADGLARFLVERVKEELSTSFFTRFKAELTRYPDLQILFPTTYAALQAVDTEIYNYSAYINLLREAFLKDFQTILPQLRRLVLDKRYDPFFDNPNNKFLKPVLLTAIMITEQLQHGKHPGDILHALANDASLQLESVDVNLKPSLQIFDLLVQSLRSKSQEHYLVPPDSIRQYLIQDEVAFRIYLGLLYQQAEQIEFTVGNQPKFLRDILSSAAAKANELDKLKKELELDLQAIADRTNAVNQTLQAIQQQNKNPETNASYREYFSFYSQTIDLLEYVAAVAEHWGSPLVEEKKNTYFFVARSVGNCYLDVNQKKYGSAVLNLFGIYDTIFVTNNLTEQISQLSSASISVRDSTRVKEMLKEARLFVNSKKGIALINEITMLIVSKSPDLAAIVKKLKELIPEIGQNQKGVLNALIKYGNFGAQLVTAENSEQVKELIASVALPAGSSSIKRKSDFNVSLNSYVGIFTGYEQIKGVDNTFCFNSYGIAAPVGVSISRGHSILFLGTGNKNSGWASSLFLSIIDVGALASFRFSNDSTETVPNIELKDIVSPGVFYSLGIPKSPLSVNVGYQVGPILRKVTATTTDYQQSYGRFSISFCVDIPLLNFYTRSR